MTTSRCEGCSRKACSGAWVRASSRRLDFARPTIATRLCGVRPSVAMAVVTNLETYRAAGCPTGEVARGQTGCDGSRKRGAPATPRDASRAAASLRCECLLEAFPAGSSHHYRNSSVQSQSPDAPARAQSPHPRDLRSSRPGRKATFATTSASGWRSHEGGL